MNGYRTRTFELHDLPGGLCTSWQRKDYSMEPGNTTTLTSASGRTTMQLDYRADGKAFQASWQ
jgi:hypothetical protein